MSSAASSFPDPCQCDGSPLAISSDAIRFELAWTNCARNRPIGGESYFGKSDRSDGASLSILIKPVVHRLPSSTVERSASSASMCCAPRMSRNPLGLWTGTSGFETPRKLEVQQDDVCQNESNDDVDGQHQRVGGTKSAVV
jgi:hypothetical protein